MSLASLAPSRVFPLPQPHTIRDLGGYGLSGGGKTRWRKFLRADQLLSDTDTDNDNDTTIWSIIMITGWKLIGFSTLIIPAANADISPALIEAARMDGASSTQISHDIRLPLLRGTVLLLVMMTMLLGWSSASAVIPAPHPLRGAGLSLRVVRATITAPHGTIFISSHKVQGRMRHATPLIGARTGRDARRIAIALAKPMVAARCSDHNCLKSMSFSPPKQGMRLYATHGSKPVAPSGLY